METQIASREHAEVLLRRMLGPAATFRDGQWEAIRAVVADRHRLLVVQKTGWGKSVVYFLATSLLRRAGAGPTLLISPLLSLMRNQQAMATRIGIRALTINSSNAEAHADVEYALAVDACDVLLVSPERLANERFLTRTLPSIPRGIGLFVVDEAHCISDWGHDFRPDYRRIVRIVANLPAAVPVLATTATANDRVVADVVEQLGPDLRVLRGPLARQSLRIQAITLGDQAERLAWLSLYLPQLEGSGIIYCLTVADCERVAGWMATQGIDAPAYHGQLPNDERVALENRLLRNEVKALVATVALGMGFDKPDLGFVVHFQRPGSIVAYYQQIGRAGRAIDTAHAVLLRGREDDDIQEFFIKGAFPSVERLSEVLHVIEDADEISENGILAQVNISKAKLQQCLDLLEVEGAVALTGSRYWRTPNPWSPEVEHWETIARIRYGEMAKMQAFVESRTCLMELVTGALDDPAALPCGRCAVCTGPALPITVDPVQVGRAVSFLKRDPRPIEPRKQEPGPKTGTWRSIGRDRRNAYGQALSMWGDAGWGQLVRSGKYTTGRFDDALVDAATELIRERWLPEPAPVWVTAVPSTRHPTLVPEFARRLARSLGLPYRAALAKVAETPEQKSMENSFQQARNLAEAFSVIATDVLPGPVLLVDDMVDSRWTFTLCGMLLRDSGSGVVHPFALAKATAGGSA